MTISFTNRFRTSMRPSVTALRVGGVAVIAIFSAVLGGCSSDTPSEPPPSRSSSPTEVVYLALDAQAKRLCTLASEAEYLEVFPLDVGARDVDPFKSVPYVQYGNAGCVYFGPASSRLELELRKPDGYNPLTSENLGVDEKVIPIGRGLEAYSSTHSNFTKSRCSVSLRRNKENDYLMITSTDRALEEAAVPLCDRLLLLLKRMALRRE